MGIRAIRLEELVNGRKYRIEVARVTADRWRARVLSAHGGPSALMPFYGTTPQHATDLLTGWLARVHRAAGPAA